MSLSKMASDRNVLTWQQALQAGWQPGHYLYAAEVVPLGKYAVFLDFKIWAKKVMAINCYCTVKHSGAKILLTVFCREGTGQYRLECSEVDFTVCPTGRLYDIEVMADQKKKIRFIQATLQAEKT